MINHFRVLGVKTNASEIDIKKAYRYLSNKYHPDKLFGLSDEEKVFAAKKLEQIMQAYQVLSDPKLRAAHFRDFKNVIVSDPAAEMKDLWQHFYP